ncbi:MAG: amino acid adenylation domain-containing protein, partial [Planctomycetota bacterium]
MNRGSSADGKQAPVDYDPFSGAPLERVVPTTESQREVWLADRLGRESSLAYNESITLRFIGQLELGGLRSALLDLVQRHEALRSTFGANGEELCIAKEGALDLVEADHSAADESVRQAAIAAAKQRAVETPFVLETGPLVRAEILKLGHADHVVILTSHHVVCDGWSFAVLVHDLLAIYAKRVHLASNELAPAVSFGDYAVAQSGLLGGEQAALDESYWLAQFREAVPILELPVDHARGAWRTFESRREDHTLDAALLAGLRKLGGQSGAGLFATSLGLFAVLLQRISGRDDLVVGVPAAGQSVDGFGSLVGHCVNLLPLRLRLDSSGTLAEAIATTQSAVLDAYEHQSYTMGSLLQKLPVERDPSRPTLISVMFNIDSAIDNKHDCPGLSVEIESNPRSYEVFEIFVNVVAVNDELRLECQYNANLFDAATIRAWLRCYETLLRAACDSQQATVGGVALSSPTDRDLLNRWNDTRRDFASGALVHELFEAQVVRVPSQPALVWRDTTLTYAEVERRANQLARTLQSLGVRRGALVGLHLERSPDWVAVMLAVLKVGAAYVPLDPSYPLERLEFMVADAGLAVVVSGESVAESLLPRERSLLLDADRELIAGQSPASLPRGADAPEPTDPAYVIYTSGSTGKPNGVCVPHRAVVNFLESMAREPGLAPDDRMVAVTTPSFDIAVTELILPLTVGAVTVLATQDEATDGASLCQLIASSAATAMQGTPATWRLLLSAGWRGGSQFKALCGGEELTANLAEKLLLCGVGELWNMYGPTETTVWSSAARITEIAAGISIGRPIANTRIWILDSRERLCPIGVPGEIWIGGDGVTLGYLGRPELTAARFLADSISGDSGAMVYRTGDRGRWRADGQLQHLGRLDFQVKVRGYRIELGEIEFRLALHSGIDAAVVIAREDRAGDVRLVAYYVPTSGSEPTVDALRAHLAHALPEYMLPQHLVCLPELPLLPNGKLDRKSLPVPDAQRLPITEYVAPGTDTERGVAEDMEAVLGMEGIGVHDDFFVLGGHSLLAAQLTYRVNSRFGHDLSMRTVFEGPTVARLAATIDGSSASPPSPRQRITRLENQRRAPASFMQERLWLLERMNPGRVVYHAPSAHRLQGALDERAFERALREVVRRQPVLRTEFDSHRHGLDQCVREDVVVSLFPAEDLSHVDPSDRDTVLLERLDELTNEKFDLSCAPLFKVRMIRLATDEHVLFFMPHHIIWDGWSFDLLYQEMSQLYAMYAQGKGTPLLPLEVSYCDFAAWHQQWLKSAECERQIDFWRERMLQVQTPRPLPADHRRQSAMSGEGSTESIAIAKEQSEALHALAAQSGATQFVATLTVFGVLLHDFARESQFVIGTPVRARMVAEVEAIMGYFNNLMLLPLQVEASETFVELLDRVRASVVESFAVPGVPLEQIERALANADGDSA